MALHSLYCADVPLRNCSLTHSLTHSPEIRNRYERPCHRPNSRQKKRDSVQPTVCDPHSVHMPPASSLTLNCRYSTMWPENC